MTTQELFNMLQPEQVWDKLLGIHNVRHYLTPGEFSILDAKVRKKDAVQKQEVKKAAPKKVAANG